MEFFKYILWFRFYKALKLSYLIGEHRGSITRKLKNSIGRHFNKCHGKKPEAFLRVVGIEKVRPEKNDILRKIRESRWINLYHSTRFGANKRD